MVPQNHRPTLTELVSDIRAALLRIEARLPGAPQPAAPPATGESLSLLDAIAQTYGAEEAEAVSAHVETFRAKAEQEADSAAQPSRRRSPRRWSIEFPDMANLLRTWNQSKKKAAYYERRLLDETDPTARLFFGEELQKHTQIADRSRSEYDRLVKQRNREARQNQT